MTVYIEFVVIDNLVMDGLIVYFSQRLMRHKISLVRIFLLAALGTALSVLLSLFTLPPALAVLTRLASGLVLVAFIAKYKSLISFFKTFLVFLGVTLVLGGACFSALFLIEGDIQRAITMGYERFPVGLIAAPLAASALLTEYLIKHLKKFKHQQPFLYKVEICCGNESVKTDGYLDSGNLLYDGHGNPVIVASKELATPLLARSILHGKTHLSTIPVSTVSGEVRMKTFKPDKLVIYLDNSVNILYDVTIGITDRHFEGYSCLLHPAVVC